MHKVLSKDELRSGRVPATSDPHVGVEIEFFCTIRRPKLVDMLFESDLRDYVTIKGDGSIEPDPCCELQSQCGCGGCGDFCPHCGSVTAGDDGHELCVLTPQSEFKSVMSRVCKFLRKINAQVNKTCGLHVHLDMRNREPRECFRNLSNAEQLLFKLVTPDRKESEYCRPVDTSDMDEASYDRYNSINVRSLDTHNTIEVRMHHGAVRYADIVPWIELLVKIVDTKKKIDRPVARAQTLGKYVALSKSLKNFIKRREASIKKTKAA